MQNKTLVIFGVIIAIIITIFFVSRMRPGELDDFAKCLSDQEAVFYGAFWCPACQEQKKIFGRSARLLPYFECSTPDGKNQKISCDQKNIESYPTWDFKGGERMTGVLRPDQLSEVSGCQLQ